MSDIVERAEALNVSNQYANREQKAALVPELVAELKAARAENEGLRSEYKKAVGPKDYWGNPR